MFLKDGQEEFTSEEQKSNMMPTKIFVGNLSETAKRGELQILFEKYGKVVECDILKNYGFVHMDGEEDAKTAIAALDGQRFAGSNMHVELSHGKSKKKPPIPRNTRNGFSHREGSKTERDDYKPRGRGWTPHAFHSRDPYSERINGRYPPPERLRGYDPYDRLPPPDRFGPSIERRLAYLEQRTGARDPYYRERSPLSRPPPEYYRRSPPPRYYDRYDLPPRRYATAPGRLTPPPRGARGLPY